MKPHKAVLLALAVLIVASMMATDSQAQRWDQKTVLTFSQPVEIPGKVLPAGTYVFKVVDSISSRDIVQIFNQDESQALAMIIAIPNYRRTPTGETVVKFAERPRAAPEALKVWFYPGDAFGHEFAYPKARAFELARTEREPVPALAVEPTPETLRTVPLIAVTPELKEEPIARAIQTTPPAAPATPAPPVVAQRQELPKTASSIPLIALFGLTFILLAYGLKFVARPVADKK